jgi:V/A-type H+/Na+-transporting ATPase subunit I
LGVARLSKVTVIAPRSDYQDVARALAKFEEFHPSDEREPTFDPAVQELAVRAVRLFAQADQTVKDLGVPLMPGTMEVVFGGVKVPKSTFEAGSWDELLSMAETELSPILDQVKSLRTQLQTAQKDGADARTTAAALEAVKGLGADVGELSRFGKLKVTLVTVPGSTLPELGKSLGDMIFASEPLREGESLAMIAYAASDAERVEKTLKALELKPLTLPPELPQVPSEAYARLNETAEKAAKDEADAVEKLDACKAQNQTRLLAIRELVGTARALLDEARMAGGLRRMASIAGYIPASREAEFKQSFGRWIVHSESVAHEAHGGKVPRLMTNPGLMRPFEILTREQGIPGGVEVDPTPLISFVFPIFFGIMFGDLGHGLILTLFALLIRQRGTGSLRQWGNIFLAAGISASVMGVLVGEFFGFSFVRLTGIPAPLEFVNHVGASGSLDPSAIGILLEIAILIGVAHITTGLGLDVVQAVRERSAVELLTEKVPALTMYLSGFGFGLAFIGAGYSFDVLKPAPPNPLLGVSNSLLGAVSLTVVLASMLVLVVGKGVAIMAGKSHEGSAGGAMANGAIEVFERMSSYLANTISYVRLAIMLLIHASLLLIVNELLVFPLYISIVPVVIFNILILVFEVLIVYIQDLRLHIYEFFTKFYKGTGVPFRKILPDRARIDILWK